jgi:hypothetical protein
MAERAQDLGLFELIAVSAIVKDLCKSRLVRWCGGEVLVHINPEIFGLRIDCFTGFLASAPPIPFALWVEEQDGSVAQWSVRERLCSI